MERRVETKANEDDHDNNEYNDDGNTAILATKSGRVRSGTTTQPGTHVLLMLLLLLVLLLLLLLILLTLLLPRRTARRGTLTDEGE